MVPTYVIMSALTAKGKTTIGAKPERIKEVNKEIEALGVKIVSQYAVLGPYDFVNIVEAPDNDTIVRMSVELGRRGTISIASYPALHVNEFIDAMKKKK